MRHGRCSSSSSTTLSRRSIRDRWRRPTPRRSSAPPRFSREASSSPSPNSEQSTKGAQTWPRSRPDRRQPRGPPRSRWSVGRIVLVVLGSLAALIGAGLLAAGGGLLWADQTQRDDDGYLSTPTERFEASSYAIVSEPIDLVEADTEGADWLLSDEVLGDVRLQAANGDLFIGVGPTSDVEAYLRGVEHHRLTDVQ